MAIIDDVWLHKINNLIVVSYSQLLGNQPSILSIAQQPPFYKIVYRAGENTYTFFIQYDFIQDRVVNGNITLN